MLRTTAAVRVSFAKVQVIRVELRHAVTELGMALHIQKVIAVKCRTVHTLTRHDVEQTEKIITLPDPVLCFSEAAGRGIIVDYNLFRRSYFWKKALIILRAQPEECIEIYDMVGALFDPVLSSNTLEEFV